MLTELNTYLRTTIDSIVTSGDDAKLRKLYEGVTAQKATQATYKRFPSQLQLHAQKRSTVSELLAEWSAYMARCARDGIQTHDMPRMWYLWTDRLDQGDPDTFELRDLKTSNHMLYRENRQAQKQLKSLREKCATAAANAASLRNFHDQLQAQIDRTRSGLVPVLQALGASAPTDAMDLADIVEALQLATKTDARKDASTSLLRESLTSDDAGDLDVTATGNTAVIEKAYHLQSLIQQQLSHQ